MYNVRMVVEIDLGIPPSYQLEAYNSKNFLQRNWHRNKFDAIDLYLSYIPDVKKHHALDIGTGSGNFEIQFNKLFDKITGVDYNIEAIEFLRKELNLRGIDNVKTFLLDVRKLKASDIPSGLDIIVILDVIEHFEFKHADFLLNALKDKLNPFGKVIVITPNYNSLWRLIEMLLDKVTIVPKFKDSQHLAKYTPSIIDKTFRKSGYKNVLLTTINTFSFFIPIDRISKFINRIEFFSKFKFGNLILAVYQKESSDKQAINFWNKQYSKDHKNLYQNYFIKKLFDMGHKWIARRNKNVDAIVDFGCGFGYHLKFEDIENKKNYYCVDKRKSMLDSIKSNKVSKILSNGIAIDIGSITIDSIVCSHILEHIKDLSAVLDEFSRIMKKNAQLLVALPCDPGFLWNLAALFSPSRLRLKMLGLDYGVVMKSEHVAKFEDIKTDLDEKYALEDEVYFPFPFIKNKNFNLIYCAKYKNIP